MQEVESNSTVIDAILEWKKDWNLFIDEVLGVTLDEKQRDIVTSAQNNQRTSVVSGTGRGKDFTAACIAICSLVLLPEWDDQGLMTHNVKVVLSAPSETQVRDIMMAEIGRLWNRAKARGFDLPGQLNSMDIRTDDKEWFLIGFKSDESTIERWTGWHAAKIVFIITEATGLSDKIFGAIEGNLQGDSRILLVFNFNTVIGYAARSQKSDKWNRYRLNSLDAPNVVDKEDKIPGQVGYNFVKGALDDNCQEISKDDVKSEEDDFEFEGRWYRPNDWWRIKILARPPKVAEDVLIPLQWVELAQERWRNSGVVSSGDRILGVDVAGMGRDCTVKCFREGDYVHYFRKHNSGGSADHMKIAGEVFKFLGSYPDAVASIDTIGEGAGVYSRLKELCADNPDHVISCKYSQAATIGKRELTDLTGEYRFANMRAFLFWAVRDWLNPKNDTGAMLPPNASFLEEATEIRWFFQSNGKIIIEPKDEIVKRLGRSTDEFDALANTFYPGVKRGWGGSGKADTSELLNFLY